MVTALIATLLAADGWTQVEQKAGVSIDKRTVAGSPYPELRLLTRSKAAPEQLAAAIWNKREGKYQRMMKQVKTLKDTPTERIYYAQIATPVISDRDYTVRQTLHIDRTANLFQMVYAADNRIGPPPVDGIVRIEKMGGTWTFEPAEGGGSEVTYICHSDPAGSLPAFVARGAQLDAAKEVWAEVEAFALSHPDAKP